MKSDNIYDTDRLLAEYLLFHYGRPKDILPYDFGPREALGFPEKCVSLLKSYVSDERQNLRALDLGCAVGRASFELARFCSDVVGIDRSQRLIAAARQIKEDGQISFRRYEEGDIFTEMSAKRPEGINGARIMFQQGDACCLSQTLGSFDVILMANLIDRVSEPAACLQNIGTFLKDQSIVMIVSPYTWLEDFTPKSRWLGGVIKNEMATRTRDVLPAILGKKFCLMASHNISFLIREHARKFQWAVSEATVWLYSM